MNSIDALTDTAFGRGSACAKAILIGEHTVLYHQPAIAIPLPTLTVTAVAHVSATVSNDDASGIPTSTTDGPIDIDFACGAATSGSQGTSAPLRADGALAAIAAASRLLGIRRRKTWIQISGNFPPARGLGFSAACAAAAIRSVADAAGERFDADTLFDLVQCGEQRTHGRASGVDAATVTSTQPILFHSGAMRPLNTDTEAVVVLADSGAPGSTRDAVRTVENVLRQERGNGALLLDLSRRIVDSALHALETADAPALGASMTEFHTLLGEFGVSTPTLDRLVKAASDAGALGAKLTGSGLGGCMIALTTPTTAAAVAEALSRKGAARTWTVPLRGRRQ